MKKYVCTVCGFVYDEAKGIPEAGISPGTKWEDIPSDWVCPLCGATKEEFKDETLTAQQKPLPISDKPTDMKELNVLEMSVICSNLAKGCEKQYKNEEAALFTELSQYYKSITPPAESPVLPELLELIEKDLSADIPHANAAAKAANDRGALRALVWNEKVTRILKSLLTRYEKEGEAMLANTGVYVCTICGFIYIGDKPPELCPVCKVPSWKFEKVERKAM